MSTFKTLRVATVQFQHKANDKVYNLSKIHQFIDNAISEKVNVLVFPEMCITGYWHVPKLPEHAIYALSERVSN
ncbi:nitrilase-related carbon-nitrogen hydrolase, partial [Proteus columbae]